MYEINELKSKLNMAFAELSKLGSRSRKANI
ncbi:hypothetical protein SAMN05880574_12130 [Chryseobacterium sp. RU37D]|nr:hypothetical protein SAMN05880574_12130 [Chryseobacterium sp. RU37D]